MTINKNKYKNIIFDLGGVILNIDYSLTEKAFANLGVISFDELFSQAKQQKLFDRYEKGEISSDNFRNEIRNHCNKSIDNATIDAAWNAMLLDLPIERLNLLRSLKTSHRIFLLSNTNDIHIKTINKYLQQTFKLSDLSEFFEKMYLSYDIGMRKPDAEIFEFLLSQNKLNPTETLFIDDSAQHIEGAKKLDIQTHWLQKNELITTLF